ncbi:hypothetical protein V8E52_003326 [Russula decolorans]
MPIFYPTLSNDSINDTTKKFHDMPKSSTEHPPSPIVGKSPPLGVTLSFGSLEAGDTVHSIPKRLIRFATLLVNWVFFVLNCHCLLKAVSAMPITHYPKFVFSSPSWDSSWQATSEPEVMSACSHVFGVERCASLPEERGGSTLFRTFPPLVIGNTDCLVARSGRRKEGLHLTLHQFVVVGGGRGDTVWQEGLKDCQYIERRSYGTGSEEAVLTGVGSTIEIYITSREGCCSRLRLGPGSEQLLSVAKDILILQRSEFTVREWGVGNPQEDLDLDLSGCVLLLEKSRYKYRYLVVHVVLLLLSKLAGTTREKFSEEKGYYKGGSGHRKRKGVNVIRFHQEGWGYLCACEGFSIFLQFLA